MPPVSPHRSSPCPHCGRIESDLGVVDVIGVVEDTDGRKRLILYQCRCRSTRAILWAQAPFGLKRRAVEAKVCFGPMRIS